MSDVRQKLQTLSAEERQALLRRIAAKRAAGAPVAIPRRPPDATAPASSGQQALWVIHRLYPGSSRYNVAGVYDVDGIRDEAAFAAAVNELVRRHEALRTTLREESGRVVQVVTPSLRVPVAVEDLSALDEAGQRAAVERRSREWMAGSFDLERGPLYRAALLRLGPARHVFLQALHHAIVDQWSLSILVRELAAIHRAFERGEPSPLAEPGLQFGDYAAWEAGAPPALLAQIDWWKSHLAGAPPLSELPADRPRRPDAPAGHRRFPFVVPPELLDGVRALARAEDVTPFNVLLTALVALLSRWSRQSDLVVGVSVAGRQRAELRDVVGFFATNLALRFSVAGRPTWRELLARVAAVVRDALGRQDVSFRRVVEAISPERRVGVNPFFQVAFTMLNFRATPLELTDGDFRIAPRDYQFMAREADLELSIVEDRAGLVSAGAAWAEYDASLFEPASVERLCAGFQRLLRSVVETPDARVGQQPLLAAEERHTVLDGWNATETRYPAAEGRSLSGLFEAQVDATPEAPAVEANGRVLGYRELDLAANRLAHLLRERGVRPEARVGLMMERSLDLAVAALAVMKAGGAYVSLDASYPPERVRFMTEDAGISVVLTHRSLSPPPAVTVLRVDGETEAIGRQPATRLPEPGADRLAYVLYTSGSTGRPKGVMVPHRAAVNMVEWTRALLGHGAGDRMLQRTPISFDVSVAEIFSTLLSGATLVMGPPDAERDPAVLMRALGELRITGMMVVPALLRALVAQPELARAAPALRYVICSGEELPADLRRRFHEVFRGEKQLYDMYGPTEAAVHIVIRHCEAGDPDPRVIIGRPVPNTRIYIVDEELCPLPVGVPGELLLGGTQLGRGYLGRPGLTAERFVPDPFGPEPGGRLYRTGDLARFLPDGRVEFLGRIDNQVKLRGYRIELGEVESVLSAQEGVRSAAVVLRKDAPTGPRLCAYVVPGDGYPGSGAIHKQLRRLLPDYMVPSSYVELASLPLTASGKVDRRALPEPDRQAVAAAEYVAPRTPTETAVAGIWAQLFGLERVGADDDFFALGGHSLLAVQLQNRLRDDCGVEVPLRLLFEQTTVAALAAAIDESAPAAGVAPVPPIEPVARDGPLPLSFAQERFFFLDRYETERAVYNVPAAVRIRGPLRTDALEQALGFVVGRHEVLRSRFVEDDDGVRQIAEAAVAAPLQSIDLGGERDPESALAARLAELVGTPFDLRRLPLLRGHLFRIGAEEHVLLVLSHHIASDGWSMGVLVGELAAAYGAYARGEVPSAPPLPVQYADYAVWQRRWLEGGELDRQRDYWLARLAGAPPVLELPLDRPRPPRQTFRGAVHRFDLPPPMVDALRATASSAGTTLFTALLAGFQGLLAVQGRAQDVVVGTPIAGRRAAALEALIGCFVNTLPIRTDLSGDPTLLALVSRAKESVLGAFAHQDLPFERLVAELRPERDLRVSPVFQAMLVLQNAPMGPIALPGLSLEPIEVDTGAAKLDLLLSIAERPDGGADCALEYNADLFDPGTAARLGERFRLVADAIGRTPSARLSRVRLLRADEERALATWNATAERYPAADGRSLSGLFEAQVDATPDAPAVEAGGRSMSYRELDVAANRLAHLLRERGVGAEARVGLMLARSLDLAVAALAVLKAGGSYVPLDASYPAERLRFMAEDARLTVVLTHGALAPPPGVAVLRLDAEGGGLAQKSPARLPEPDAGAVAYVLYTSGSTGRPKGVMVPHRAAVNMVQWRNALLGHRAGDRYLQRTPISFDVSVAELFCPLLSGAALVMGPPDAERDPGVLVRALRELRISCLTLVPALFRALLAEPELAASSAALRYVVCSGEELGFDLRRRFHELFGGKKELYNFYGPTEAAVDTVLCRCEADDGDPRSIIGRPVANTRVYVVDEELSPLPIGVPGELLIGGMQLGRGYFARPALTAERFVPDPFGAEAGGRLYRTGDLARFLPDGRLEYLGRIDHQVKLRGYRIELGEVEAVLTAQAGVRAAAVVLRKDERTGPRLCAYVVPGDGYPGSGALHKELRRLLPEFMVPSSYVELLALPLSPSGKVDRKALPEPDRQAVAAAEYVAPRTATETAIARIWAELLGLDRVGVDDDFFALGGHSLVATRVMARLSAELGISLPLHAFFEAPTVAGLALRIAEELAAGDEALLARLDRIGDAELEAMSEAELARFLEGDEPGS